MRTVTTTERDAAAGLLRRAAGRTIAEIADDRGVASSTVRAAVRQHEALDDDRTPLHRRRRTSAAERRAVEDAELDAFFTHQQAADACRMAASFRARA